MKLLHLSVVFYCLFTTGCKEDIIPDLDKGKQQVQEDSIGKHPEFELVWRIGDSTSLPRKCFLHNSAVIAIDQGGANARVFACEKQTGKLLWRWDAPGPIDIQSASTRNGQLYFTIHRSLYALNIDNGSLAYTTYLTYGYPDLSVTEHGVFVHNEVRSGSYDEYFSTIHRIDDAGNQSLVSTIRASEFDNYLNGTTHITSWIHPSGDTILYCDSRAWNWSPRINQGKGHFYAVNITADSLYHDWTWDVDAFDNSGKAVLHNNELFVSDGWSFVGSIDLTAKEWNWQTRIREDKATGTWRKMYYHDGVLYIPPGNHAIMNAFNASTGQHLRSISQIGTESFFGNYMEHKGLIWMTTTLGMYALENTSTVRIKYQVNYDEPIGNTGGTFTEGLQGDPESGYLYVTRGRDLVCYKLKD